MSSFNLTDGKLPVCIPYSSRQFFVRMPLVLDDWGLGPFTAAESCSLLQVPKVRTQLRTTIISTPGRKVVSAHPRPDRGGCHYG